MRCRSAVRKSACRPNAFCGANATSLAALIRSYKASEPPLNEMLRYFRSLPLNEAIRRGAGAIGPDGKMYSHQWRLGHAVCGAAADKLTKHEKRLAACKSFSELKSLIEELTADISGFGRLARYDAALRIGSKLKLLPMVVDLHAGTRKGARYWGFDTRKGYLEMSELDAEFRSLKPHEIENFLCNYRKELKALRARLGA